MHSSQGKQSPVQEISSTESLIKFTCVESALSYHKIHRHELHLFNNPFTASMSLSPLLGHETPP